MIDGGRDHRRVDIVNSTGMPVKRNQSSELPVPNIVTFATAMAAE
jgi:hypothetical protein